MWIYLLIGVVVVYALIKEREQLGCFSWGKDCDNSNGKPLRGTQCDSDDATSEVCEKMKQAADFSSKWVIWRLALLSSLIAVLLIFLFLYQRMPSEIETLASMFIITCVIYFTIAFYQFHLLKPAKEHLHTGIDILGSRVSSRT
jgi:hypothetical protein